ncbi:MAG: hypothetical protein JWO33_421, partial [Caulobacteraceae bacterium]|nr:hypothetical protein [Caulobacteraceae bacterium]
LRATARTQDLAFQAVLAAIKPGMRDFEVTAAARYACELLGSEDGLYLGSSGPPNTSAGLLRRPNMQGAAVVEGGYYTILIECAGPGGLYSELARSIVLGEPSAEQQDELAIVCEAQDNTAQLLRPGADPAEICRLHAEFMQGRDRPAEVRNYAHGQGYDVMERPLIRPEETMTIGEDMCFAIHPSYATATAYAFVCDNFMVMPQGPAMRLHQTPQKVFSA